ncbi:Lnb N-terminal periplasmic domain-containing protein [Prevotella pectinovora]|uniref:Lnb N-terminal periplasmic domain-containing protein n=1 Tax=Prevotella pectinovora TaxID=1602169 RepID=UPI0005C6E7B5|nr:DUF4105 domain-containing protein [Prevotella pectinovora]
MLDISKIAIGNTTNYAETPADSIRVSLLTCSPHDEIYSLYGHTAIRYEDKASKTDIVVNYGMFSFKKPFFVARFVLGLTDYEMGIQDFNDFCYEYQYFGSQVTQQEINLTPEEKGQLLKALQDNYDNARVYRYNYFYNNCTTKARDIILKSINGKIEYENAIDKSVSFRDLIHGCNANYSWASFGNDLLLGFKADMQTTREEQQFLPDNLMRDFGQAKIVSADGSARPLVKNTEIIVKGNDHAIAGKTKVTPQFVFITLLLLIAAIVVAEFKTKKRFLWVDISLLLASGLAGLILFVMLFSEHPTTSTNLQIFILCPLNLYWAIYIIKNKRNERKLRKAWTFLSIMLCIGLSGRLIQVYAEGMPLLALSLLLKNCCNLYATRKND